MEPYGIFYFYGRNLRIFLILHSFVELMMDFHGILRVLDYISIKNLQKGRSISYEAEMQRKFVITCS